MAMSDTSDYVYDQEHGVFLGEPTQEINPNELIWDKEHPEQDVPMLDPNAPVFNVRSAVLGSAMEAVLNDRQTNYGTPESNFGLIADLWTAYKRVDFTPDDVAAMQILLKLARHKNAKHLDNAVDIAGYAACMAEVDFRD